LAATAGRGIGAAIVSSTRSRRVSASAQSRSGSPSGKVSATTSRVWRELSKISTVSGTMKQASGLSAGQACGISSMKETIS